MEYSCFTTKEIVCCMAKLNSVPMAAPWSIIYHQNAALVLWIYNMTLCWNGCGQKEGEDYWCPKQFPLFLYIIYLQENSSQPWYISYSPARDYITYTTSREMELEIVGLCNKNSTQYKWPLHCLPEECRKFRLEIWTETSESLLHWHRERAVEYTKEILRSSHTWRSCFKM